MEKKREAKNASLLQGGGLCVCTHARYSLTRSTGEKKGGSADFKTSVTSVYVYVYALADLFVPSVRLFLSTSGILDPVNLHLIILSSRQKDVVTPVDTKDLLRPLSVGQAIQSPL